MPFRNEKYALDVAKHAEQTYKYSEKLKDCPKLSAVDQLDAQPFMRGANGFNRNIISQIMAAESMELKEMLLKKLGDLSKLTGFDSSVPAQDVLDTVIPRNIQTASSMRDWLSANDKSIGKYVDELKAEYDRQQAFLNPPKEVVSETNTES